MKKAFQCGKCKQVYFTEVPIEFHAEIICIGCDQHMLDFTNPPKPDSPTCGEIEKLRKIHLDESGNPEWLHYIEIIHSKINEIVEKVNELDKRTKIFFDGEESKHPTAEELKALGDVIKKPPERTAYEKVSFDASPPEIVCRWYCPECKTESEMINHYYGTQITTAPCHECKSVMKLIVV